MLHYTYFIDVMCVKLDKFRICGTTYDTYTKVPLAGSLTLAPIMSFTAKIGGEKHNGDEIDGRMLADRLLL